MSTVSKSAGQCYDWPQAILFLMGWLGEFGISQETTFSSEKQKDFRTAGCPSQFHEFSCLNLTKSLLQYIVNENDHNSC